MAGHSKWSNIKHKKACSDIKKGKLFTKLMRDVTTAVKVGDKNVKFNCKLKSAVDKALSNNISKSVINKAMSDSSLLIDKNMESNFYSGYWKFGIAFVIDCIILNRNRIASELRYLFTKYNGDLVPFNSVAYLFKKIVRILLISGYSDNLFNDICFRFNTISYISGCDYFFIEENDFEKIKFFLKNNNIIFKYFFIMSPISIININNNDFNVVSSLVKSFKKLDYVKNVFVNVNL
ncbi:MAG TPA: YebC/PmpR family DNA-binding transcriptional regulator [Candidatus Azoamicus sp. OHIO1]